MIPDADARTSLILAAERLFAEHGIEGVSLRQVQSAAGQRFKSASQYYFGDREGLISAVLDFRQREMNATRAALLDRLEREGRQDDIRSLVEVLARPLIDMIGTPAESYLGFLAALMRYRDRGRVLAPERPFAHAAQRATELLHKALDPLPKEEIHGRVALLEVMLVHGLADAPRFVSDSPLPERRRVRHFTDTVINGVTAVLTAPPPDTMPSGRKRPG